tara:strand:+ start:428 stop:2023 length:1596 start_codon:yes stop_codon:yes gene_type:complete
MAIQIDYDIIILKESIKAVRKDGILYIKDAELDPENFNIRGTLDFNFHPNFCQDARLLGKEAPKDTNTQANLFLWHRGWNSWETRISNFRSCKPEVRSEILKAISDISTENYEKKVFEYLSKNLNKIIDLFQLLNEGLILLFDQSNRKIADLFSERYNNRGDAIGYYVNINPIQPGNMYIVPSIGGAGPEASLAHPGKQLKWGDNPKSYKYKLHIKVNLEYIQEALRELLEFPKLYDYFSDIKVPHYDFRKTDFKVYDNLLRYLGSDNDKIDAVFSNLEYFLSEACASIVIYPLIDLDRVARKGMEELLIEFKEFWSEKEETHPHWKMERNYLMYNIRITDTFYFAYGSSTGDRNDCYRGKKADRCYRYKEPAVLTRIKDNFCKDGRPLPKYNGVDMADCLKNKFNIKNYETLCEDGPMSLSHTFGLAWPAEDFPLLDVCEEDPIHMEAMEDREMEREAEREERRRERRAKRRSWLPGSRIGLWGEDAMQWARYGELWGGGKQNKKSKRKSKHRKSRTRRKSKKKTRRRSR